jgi:hypothetical protein
MWVACANNPAGTWLTLAKATGIKSGTGVEGIPPMDSGSGAGEVALASKPGLVDGKATGVSPA